MGLERRGSPQGGRLSAPYPDAWVGGWAYAYSFRFLFFFNLCETIENLAVTRSSFFLLTFLERPLSPNVPTSPWAFGKSSYGETSDTNSQHCRIARENKLQAKDATGRSTGSGKLILHQNETRYRFQEEGVALGMKAYLSFEKCMRKYPRTCLPIANGIPHETTKQKLKCESGIARLLPLSALEQDPPRDE